jgi:hypothetical protein
MTTTTLFVVEACPGAPVFVMVEVIAAVFAAEDRPVVSIIGIVECLRGVSNIVLLLLE